METHCYFAYGSNMSSEQMSVRCPDAVKVGLATLVGYEFMINKRGVAGVIKKQGASVIGILWTISINDKATLDRCEGADRPDGPYSLEEIAVNTENGPVVALVYIAKNTCLGSPREGYLERIVNAAVDHGIDQGYVDFLKESRMAHERQVSPKVEDCSVSPYKLFERFAPAIRDLTVQEFLDPSSGLIQKMNLASEANLEVCYAPLEFCNPKARLVIVGITPGLTQMVNSLKEAQLQLSAEADSGAALMAAQRIGAFSGTMRVNLIRLLDHIGVNDWLEIKSCDALFGEAAELVQWTSVLRNPVFKNGKNYNGTPKLTSHSLLKEQLNTYFVADIQKMPNAVFVPLGVKVTEALHFLADQKIISKDRILDGLPHPSAANAERIAYFLSRKDKASLSRRTNPCKLDQGRSDLINKIKVLVKKRKH
jgi:Gamma-glutamyl cyclotransferase, AIG2-like